jgi:hypothetical protein
MAISNETAYFDMVDSPFQRARFSKNTLTTVAGRAFSSWLQGAGFPPVGVAPTTAAVPTAATAGSLKGGNGDNLYNSSGTRRIVKCVIDHAPTVAAGGMVTIVDRLSHQGGLSGASAVAQTTNLPTAALTRYTTGVGVQIGLEIYAQIGTTPTTVTTSYTDTVPTAGRINPAATIGNTGFREASRIIVLPLASGDVGVTSVQSVTLAASTLTAGNFGVTLFYPLVHIALDDILSIRGMVDALHGFGCWFPEVKSDACLHFIYHTAGAVTGIMQGDVQIAEDR